MVLSL
jgi:hypothetical protein